MLEKQVCISVGRRGWKRTQGRREGHRKETEDPPMGSRGAGAGEEYCVSTKDTKVHSAAGEGGRGDYTVYADREAETTGEEGGYGPSARTSGRVLMI